MPSKTTIPQNTLAVGDCLKLMAQWPAASVDLIFADPPYNIGYAYDQYHDQRTDEDYIAWTCRWISACTRLLKPTGSLYVLIGDEYAAETRLHLKQLERDRQLLFRNWIVWHYTFGQRCKIKFNRSHAHLFYAVGPAACGTNGKNKVDVKNPPFTFNYDAVALPSARMTTYKDKRQNPAGKLPDDTWYLKRFPDALTWHTRPQEAAEETEAGSSQDIVRGYFRGDQDTWYQPRLCGTFNERQQWHPCQLPEALLERIIKVSSNPGDLVFDPFAGSGTTLAVAHKLSRHWLGCELSKSYAAKAKKRIKETRQVVPAAGNSAANAAAVEMADA
ncbi:MAG: site-specific DNA-methyltransferase [Phycisphaeraceae bacterium]|nr:site-specific DNA-methyltransferase [Phycisphaeraceae bacterium]